jgi:hypothetical protein
MFARRNILLINIFGVSEMNKKLIIGAVFAMGVVGSIHAAINGGPSGYGGSAWFDSGQGVVATGATYSECQTMLNNAITYRENNWGWTVVEYNGCSKRTGYRREK